MSLAVPGVEGLTEVGRGGGGVVYRAWQPDFGRWVAVKVFAPDEDVRRLERERLAVGRLSDHPGIVPVLGGGVTGDGRPYLLMAFMDGGSLADRVRARGVLPPAEVAAVGTALAWALQVAHDNGVWHRDLKPANILYDRFGTPRLADFGIAHVGDDAFRTEAGAVSGTVAYMAPELIDGRPFTPAADVFSLGATLYFALEGRHLFEPGPQELYAAFLVRRLTAPHRPQFSPAVPGWLRDVVAAATEPEASRRPPTAAALADALARGAAAMPTGPSVPGPSVPGPAGAPGPGAPPPAWGTPGPRTGQGTDAPVVVGLTGIPPRRWARPAAVVAASAAVVVVAAALWANSPSRRDGGGTAAPTTPGLPAPATPLGSTPKDPASAQVTTPQPATAASGAGLTAAADGGGAPAVRQALGAFRAAMGGGNPQALQMIFYPYPGMGSGGAWAVATLPQPDAPVQADRYTFRDGTLRDPEPVAASDDLAPAKRWRFDEVSWSSMDAMLRNTQRVCRAVMTKAGYQDQPDTFGRTAGISHLMVERDTVFSGGRVVVRVYFTGGARWGGGYVQYTAAGKLMTNYCRTG